MKMLRSIQTFASAGKRGRSAAFTLVELVLVMSMLVVILALVAPSLGRFFKGRSLDSEARRLVTLTHYAQSRAVSEGIPMMLWISPDDHAYGLEAEYSYNNRDDRAVYYELNKDLEVEIERVAPLQMDAQARQAQTSRFGRNATVMRFTPDGFISETSPQNLWLRQRQENRRAQVAPADEIWIGQTLDRLKYAIQTNELAIARR